MATRKRAGDKATILYPDLPSLYKPLSMPRSLYPLVATLALAAAIIGAFVGTSAFDTITHANERQQAQLQAIIARGVNLDLPVLASYVYTENEALEQALAEAGYSLANMPALGLDDFGFGAVRADAPEGTSDLVKLPVDVTLEESGLLAGGLSSLDADRAVTFVSASWRLTVVRGEGLDMRLRYVDFSATNPEEAIANGLAAQGWQDQADGEVLFDDAGNTYREGVAFVGDDQFLWVVSVCRLDEVSDISSMPEGYYVVIRLFR